MNLEVPQCKNCWKWGHRTFTCRIQELKYIKCNGPHKTKHHHHFAWYCKVNYKTNLLRLKMKQGELCPHSFKYLNCKGNHQANSNTCPFWKHCFNKEWHTKKYQEFWKIGKNSICSSMSIAQAWLLKISRFSHRMFERTNFSQN